MANKILTIAKINKILFPVFLLAAAFCLYDIGANVLPGFSKMASIEPGAPAGKKTEMPRHAAAKPLDYYARPISGKNLFKAQAADNLPQGPASGLQPQFLNTMLSDAAGGLVLKGVIAGQPMQAVIEETKTGKTYFVEKNDKIGDIIIDDIAANKVRLRSADQAMDLTL